jgi:type IV pilus assembly protein PilO
MAKSPVLKGWSALPLQRKVLFASALGCILVVGLWFFVFKPPLDTIHTLEQDIDRLDQTITTFKTQVQKLPELRKELDARKREMLHAQTLLPETSADVENLLSSIEKLGNDAGIDFLLFTPGQRKTHDFYASRTVSVRFQGTFHNLMRFFDHLSGLDRLVTLESVQLRPVSKITPKNVSLQADCQLQIYRVLSEQEKKAQKST